jgi:hypothetical protein
VLFFKKPPPVALSSSRRDARRALTSGWPPGVQSGMSLLFAELLRAGKPAFRPGLA